MPLKFPVGSVIKSTSTLNFGSGVTAFSAQAWYLPNSDAAPCVSPDHATIFGSATSAPFWFTSNPAGYDLVTSQMSGTGPAIKTVSSVRIGQPNHLVITWDGSVARTYLNGVKTGQQTATGTLATTNITLSIGDNNRTGGTDYFLMSEVAVWAGYALSETDINNLRDRVSAPTDISSANLLHYYTLDGTAGDSPATGSDPLSNQGTAGATAFTVTGSPVYDATSMVYDSGLTYSIAKVGPSQKTVVLAVRDGEGNKQPLTAINSTPTVKADGTEVAVTSVLSGPDRYYALLNLASAIGTSAAVTVDVDTAWASTALGGLAAATGVEVENDTTLLPAFEATAKTMTMGYNIASPSYFSPVLMFADAMRHGGDWSGGVFTQDDNGEILTYTSGTLTQLICRNGDSPLANGFNDAGYPSAPPGTWTLMWDGSDTTIALQATASGASMTLIDSSTGNATDNWKTYTLDLGSTTFYGAVQATVSSGNASNVRVYPPGQPTDGSALFHSDFLRMLQGCKVLRFMDGLQINGSNLRDFDEFTPTSRRGLTRTSVPARTGNVTSITGWTDSTPAYLGWGHGPGWVTFKATCSNAHGFREYDTVQFPSIGTPLNMSDGGTLSISRASGIVHVIDDYNFAFAQYYDQTKPTVTVDDTTIAFAATVNVNVNGYGHLPPEYAIDLCNAVGADLHINLPHLLTDEASATLADLVWENLNSGLKCKVEYTNEHWNVGPSFPQSAYCGNMAVQDGEANASAWYALRASQHHDVWAARAAVAGRPASDLVRLFAGQSANVGVCNAIVTKLTALGKTMDEFAIAPYFSVGPDAPTTLDDVWDSMDLDQILDATEMDIQEGFHAGCVANHVAALATAFPDAKVVSYEGGLESGVPLGTDATRSEHCRQWVLHPRIKDSLAYMFQSCQDAGMASWCYYQAAQGLYNKFFTWGVYQYTTQLAGAGDGSDGKFDNRTDYEDLPNVVSPPGATINQWIALSSSDAPLTITGSLVTDGLGMSPGAYLLGGFGGDVTNATIDVTALIGAGVISDATATTASDVTVTAAALAGSGIISDVSGVALDWVQPADPFAGSGTLPDITVVTGGNATVVVSPLTGSGIIPSPSGLAYDWTQDVDSFAGSGTLSDATASTSIDITVDASALTGSGSVPDVSGVSLGWTQSVDPLAGFGTIPLLDDTTIGWDQAANPLAGHGTIAAATVTVGTGVVAYPNPLAAVARIPAVLTSTGIDAFAFPDSLAGSGRVGAATVDTGAGIDATAFASPLSAAGRIAAASVGTGTGIDVIAFADPLAGSGVLPLSGLAFDWTQSVSPFSGSGTISSIIASIGVDAIVSPLAGSAALPDAGLAYDWNQFVAPLIGRGGLGFPDAQPGWLFRGADILDAIADMLEATREFDSVYRHGVGEVGRDAASHGTRSVFIESMNENESDLWDDPSGPSEVVSGQVGITIVVRDQDPRDRDRMADRLKNVARNALNGRSICNLTLPDFTRFSTFQTQRAQPPSRMIRGTLVYKYLVDSFVSYAVND